MTTNGKQLQNARQVAERLQVSVAWVLAHAAGRRLPILPSHKMGNVVRFIPAEIDLFVEHCRRAMEQGRPIQ
jgi:hypothetical protein